MNGWGRTWLVRRAARFLRRRGIHVAEERYSSNYLRRYGFSIQTFVDVGVFRGSPPFYELFHDRKVLLIDPMLDQFDQSRSALAKSDVEIFRVAVGENPGRATLTLNASSSSLLNRHGGRTPEGSKDVEVVRLDDILADYRGPFGIKIDTEGFDLAVLKGAEKSLERTTFVFTEASLRRRFDENYRFSEMIDHMAKHGFEPAEILSPASLNGFVDVLFVRADSDVLDMDRVKVSKIR